MVDKLYVTKIAIIMHSINSNLLGTRHSYVKINWSLVQQVITRNLYVKDN